MSGIPDELSRLRPYLVIWFNNLSKCVIIEVSIPYASVQWNADTLENVYNHKMEKYIGLVTFLRNQGIDVMYGAVIVSSVVEVIHESVKDINKIFVVRKICKTIIKQLATNSIIGSLKVWNHNKSNQNLSAPLNTPPHHLKRK